MKLSTIDQKKNPPLSELEKLERTWLEKTSKNILKKFQNELNEKNYTLQNVMRDIQYELQFVDFSSEKLTEFIFYMEDLIAKKLGINFSNGNEKEEECKENFKEKEDKKKDKDKETPKSNSCLNILKKNSNREAKLDEKTTSQPKNPDFEYKNPKLENQTSKEKNENLNSNQNPEENLNLNKDNQNFYCNDDYKKYYCKDNKLLRAYKEKQEDEWGIVSNFKDEEDKQNIQENRDLLRRMNNDLKNALDCQLRCKQNEKSAEKIQNDNFFQTQKNKWHVEEEEENKYKQKKLEKKKQLKNKMKKKEK
jgi:hypothetical protein